MLRSVSVDGPRKHGKESYPPSQFQILRRTARHDRGRWRDVEQAATDCLKPLMRRAFRQQVSDEEVQPYARLVKDATDHGDSYYRGLQIAISAVLVSPRFLFRVETPPDDWKPTTDDDDRAADPTSVGNPTVLLFVEQHTGRAIVGRCRQGTVGSPRRSSNMCAA